MSLQRALSGGLLLVSRPVAAQVVDSLLKPDPKDWLNLFRAVSRQRHSPLWQITAANVRGCRPSGLSHDPGRRIWSDPHRRQWGM